jgi:SAM-dependent methyltransferase
MNWAKLRLAPWLDTRAKFVARTARGGNLLDLGSADGETLRHIAELRPDLHLFATDLEGKPENYPDGCEFHRGDLQVEKLPWADSCMSTITCLHLVEHLRETRFLLGEVKRLLQPGGEAYIETPHPKTVDLPSAKTNGVSAFTLNFYDDSTHVKVVDLNELANEARAAGLEIVRTGVSRNWLFAASHLIYRFAPASRQKYTAQVHWIGWSAYLIVRRPGNC